MISGPLCLWLGHMPKKGSKINNFLYAKFLYTKIEQPIYITPVHSGIKLVCNDTVHLCDNFLYIKIEYQCWRIQVRGGRIQSRNNLTSKIKKWEYKLNEKLHGQSSNGHRGHARFWTSMAVKMTFRYLPNIVSHFDKPDSFSFSRKHYVPVVTWSIE